MGPTGESPASLKEHMDEEQALNQASIQINNNAKVVKASAPKKTSMLDNWIAFVNKNGLAITRDGKTYLRVEAWNYLFSIKGLAPTILEIKTHVSDDGGDVVFLAKAGLIPMTSKIDEDIPLGATAFAACTIGESDYCNGYYSALSMAQTRAIGKLGRTVFGHLAVACGFQATPLEELPDGR